VRVLADITLARAALARLGKNYSPADFFEAYGDLIELARGFRECSGRPWR
jgi:elongation factor P--beta-lysine ligase